MSWKSPNKLPIKNKRGEVRVNTIERYLDIPFQLLSVLFLVFDT